MRGMNRWYDHIPDLGDLIEKIKLLSKEEKNDIFVALKDIIIEYDYELIDRHVVDFPLNFKRRWYDHDPYSWLIINSLKYADDTLIKKVLEYLKKKLG